MSRHDLTAHIAYTIYQQRGYAHGRHAEDWFAAEMIVGMCEAVFSALSTGATPAPDTAPNETEAPREYPTLAKNDWAMQLLHEAVAEQGRKAVAGQLGYKSTSTVGKYLRGDRALGQALVEKIVAAFGQQARRAA
jgi:hypothetical protein